MNQQLKKISSIVFASIIGLTIIFFVWRNGLPEGNKVSVSVDPVVSGESWKASLLSTQKGQFIKPSTLPDTNTAVSAKTETDALARNLLVNYALTQKNMSTTTWDNQEAEALAQSLINNVELPAVKQYTTKDLNISTDNSEASIISYGGKILNTVQASSANQKDREVTVFLSAISEGDPQKIEGLSRFITEYSNTKKTLLSIKTPSGVAPLHLRLVQNYANIESALIAMKKVFSDPVLGIAGFTQYKKEIIDLSVIGNDYKNYQPVYQ